MKTLKFRSSLVDQVKQGSKNSTWRLFDDKNLTANDDIQLLIWETKEPFAEAVITKIIEKPLGQLTEIDKQGHEIYESDAEMHKTYSEYYNTKVGPDTLIKLIWFELK